MKVARCYIECSVFVMVWVTCGWLFHPSTEVYLILGVPLVLFFQSTVARRPLPELWVRDPGPFRLDCAGAAVTAILMLVPVAALVKQRDSWERVLVFSLAIIGAAPGAFALRRQRWEQVVQAFPAFAAAAAIGCVCVAIALHDGRSPVPGVAELPFIGLNSLWIFASCFVVEEVAFRGALDTHVASVASGGKQAWVSAVFVSVLWGLWHFPLSPSRDLQHLAVTLGIHTVLGVPLSFCWRGGATLVLPAAAHALMDAYRNVVFLS